ncbi:hypothetical protein NT03LS_3204, partial [Listeria seeligeri FSL N1-067]
MILQLIIAFYIGKRFVPFVNVSLVINHKFVFKKT